jgi:dipeptidyl aminopeptidase/acylaminoacyl peptidase
LKSPLIVACAAASALATSAAAGLDVPGYDPTPIEIPKRSEHPSRPITSKDLLTLRDLHGVQMSPDGKYVAFVVGQAVLETNSYRSGLFVVKTDGTSGPISLGTVGAPRWDDVGQWLEEQPQWSVDSQYIYYAREESGKRQVWRWRREGGAPVQLTHVPNDLQSFALTADGAQIVLQTVQPPEAATVARMQERGMLYEGNSKRFDSDFHPWDRESIVQTELDRMPKEIHTWLVDLVSGVERAATPEEVQRYEGREESPQQTNDELIEMGRASPDGKLFAYLAWRDPGKALSVDLWVRPASGGPATLLAAGSYVYDFWWSADSRQIYFDEYAEDGRPLGFTVVAAKGGKAKRLIVATEGERLTAWSTDRAGTLVLCTRETSVTPQEIAVFDLRRQQVRVLVDLNPEFKNLTLSPSTRIEWRDKDRQFGSGYLVKPLGYEPGKRYPLIVTTYLSGNGFLRGGVGDEFPIQVFAANGFAVLDFTDNHIVAFPKNGDFKQTRAIWNSPVASLEAVLHRLDELSIIDPKRTGITGLSHGAMITVFTISRSNLFQAASVSVANGFDPYFYYLGGKFWRGAFAGMGLNGLLEGTSLQRWREISPAMNATSIRAPLLSNAPDSEFLVSLQEITALQELGKPVEMFIYANELHVKNQPMHRYEVYERNVDWFNFWLQGKEDSNPSKTVQFARWRKLRAQHEWNERMLGLGKDPAVEFMHQQAPGAPSGDAELAPESH